MGLTVLDAGILIGLLNPDDVHHASATKALHRAHHDADVLVMPVSAYAEALVHPSRRGPDAVGIAEAAIDRIPIRIQALDRTTARSAAMVRAAHRSLKLPDALVIATAIELDADVLLTTDQRWPSAPDLRFGGRLVTV